MTKKNLYKLVEDLLAKNKRLRDNDKALMWEVWKLQGAVDVDDNINYPNFKAAVSPETVRRTRQKIQELKPYLGAEYTVRRARTKKQQSKGFFVFEEEIKTV